MPYMAKPLEPFKILVGNRLRTARVDAGFQTQEDLARAIGVDESVVNRWEKGRVQPKKHLDDLCRLLKITKDELLKPMENPEQPAEAKALATLVNENATLKAEIEKLKSEGPTSIPGDILEALTTASESRLNSVRAALRIPRAYPQYEDDSEDGAG